MSRSPLSFSRRKALWLMGGMIGGVSLHACTQQPPTASTSPEASPTAGASPASMVKASTGSTLWIGYTPLYIAVEKGFFKEGGLDLESRVFSSSGEGNAAFAAGRMEGTNLVTSEAVALAAKGQDYRVIMVADSSLGGDGILARNSIKDIADFKGKTIAVEIGSVSHFFLLQVLQTVGLTGNDVEITNVTPDAAAAAYSSGRVDVAVTYSPFLKQANDAQSDGRIIFDTSKMPTAIVDVYIFNTQFLQANPQAGEAFVRGILKAHEFLKTNPDEALTIAGKQLQLTPEEVKVELQGVDLTSLENNVKMLSDPQSDRYLATHMDALGKFLKEQNQVPEAPTLDQFKTLLEPTYVKAVQATP